MKRFLLICLVSLLSAPAFCQGVLNVRINEVLVINESDIIDGYGKHSSWIELFNTGYENVNIGGCFLGIRYADRFDENGNKLITKYYIPNTDPSTQMGTWEYRTFFCEGTDTKGTYYTSFTLEDENFDMIILYNSNGRDIISVFKFPGDYQAIPDVSWGLIGHEEPESYIFPDVSKKGLTDDQYMDALAAGHKYQPQQLTRTTPGATNEATAEVSKDELFRRNDPNGVVMTLTAMGVVFLALIILFALFKLVGIIMMSRTNKKEAVSKGVPREEAKAATTGRSGEEIAAIGLALKMFQEDLHVKESTVITINRVGRMYSPWSSKIYGLREIPVKKNR